MGWIRKPEQTLHDACRSPARATCLDARRTNTTRQRAMSERERLLFVAIDAPERNAAQRAHPARGAHVLAAHGLAGLASLADATVVSASTLLQQRKPR